MDPLPEIRQAIEEGRYDLTHHAVQEIAEDDLHVVDLESAVLTGSIVESEFDPARGHRYVIEGVASDLLTRVGVVARYRSDQDVVIITVYEIGPDG